MTPRERFWKNMHFEQGGGLPDWADWIGPWKRWGAEGLPVRRALWGLNG